MSGSREIPRFGPQATSHTTSLGRTRGSSTTGVAAAEVEEGVEGVESHGHEHD